MISIHFLLCEPLIHDYDRRITVFLFSNSKQLANRALFNSRSWTQGKGDRDVTIILCYWLHVIISTSVCLQTSGIEKATKHLMVQGGGAVGPRIYRKPTLFGGSFGKDTILLTECSILDSWYETRSNFTNNCWGAPDYTSLVGGR